MHTLIQNILQNLELALQGGEGLRLERLDGIPQEAYYQAFHIVEEYAKLVQGKGYITSNFQEVSLCLQLLSKEPELVIDIGANVGNWTCELLDRVPTCEVLMFEPSVTNVEALNRRFSSASIRIFNLGISDEEGQDYLYGPSAGSVLASRISDGAAEYREQVKFVGLDSFLTQRFGYLPKIDILKLDIEGGELSALRSSITALERTSVVQFEFGHNNLNWSIYMRDLFSFFNQLDFEVLRATPIGVRILDSCGVEEEVFRTSTLFARNKNYYN